MAAASFFSRWRVRAGYPLAILFLYLASPTPSAIAIGAAIAAGGLVVRGAAAGHLRKLETLTTSGPYAWMRNPLYFGSALLAAGFAVAGHSPWAALVLIAYFGTFYPVVMKKEEGELRERYGAAFVAYAERVPLFFRGRREWATGHRLWSRTVFLGSNINAIASIRRRLGRFWHWGCFGCGCIFLDS